MATVEFQSNALQKFFVNREHSFCSFFYIYVKCYKTSWTWCRLLSVSLSNTGMVVVSWIWVNSQLRYLSVSLCQGWVTNCKMNLYNCTCVDIKAWFLCVLSDLFVWALGGVTKKSTHLWINPIIHSEPRFNHCTTGWRCNIITNAYCCPHLQIPSICPHTVLQLLLVSIHDTCMHEQDCLWV